MGYSSPGGFLMFWTFPRGPAPPRWPRWPPKTWTPARSRWPAPSGCSSSWPPGARPPMRMNGGPAAWTARRTCIPRPSRCGGTAGRGSSSPHPPGPGPGRTYAGCGGRRTTRFRTRCGCLSTWLTPARKKAAETMAMSSADLFTAALEVTPGRGNSPVRAFGPVGGEPRFIDRGSGAYLHDVDGRSYVDLVCSWGPMILRHGHPAVVSAVSAALARGTSFGAATPGEVALATEIIARAPVEQVRLVNSGTEATMAALRLARGYTGRALVVKVAGRYHGHVDALLVAAGSGGATLGLADTPGL